MNDTTVLGQRQEAGPLDRFRLLRGAGAWWIRLLDLRSPRIPEGDMEVRVQADRSAIKLPVPQDGSS